MYRCLSAQVRRSIPSLLLISPSATAADKGTGQQDGKENSNWLLGNLVYSEIMISKNYVEANDRRTTWELLSLLLIRVSVAVEPLP